MCFKNVKGDAECSKMAVRFLLEAPSNQSSNSNSPPPTPLVPLVSYPGSGNTWTR
jgi:hypothetical protein